MYELVRGIKAIQYYLSENPNHPLNSKIVDFLIDSNNTLHLKDCNVNKKYQNFTTSLYVFSQLNFCESKICKSSRGIIGDLEVYDFQIYYEFFNLKNYTSSFYYFDKILFSKLSLIKSNMVNNKLFSTDQKALVEKSLYNLSKKIKSSLEEGIYKDNLYLILDKNFNFYNSEEYKLLSDILHNGIFYIDNSLLPFKLENPDHLDKLINAKHLKPTVYSNFREIEFNSSFSNISEFDNKLSDYIKSLALKLKEKLNLNPKYPNDSTFDILLKDDLKNIELRISDYDLKIILEYDLLNQEKKERKLFTDYKLVNYFGKKYNINIYKFNNEREIEVFEALLSEKSLLNNDELSKIAICI